MPAASSAMLRGCEARDRAHMPSLGAGGFVIHSRDCKLCHQSYRELPCLVTEQPSSDASTNPRTQGKLRLFRVPQRRDRDETLELSPRHTRLTQVRAAGGWEVWLRDMTKSR
jgi:hypothetical protein